MKKLKSQWGKQMTETEKAIRDFCGHHADWWPSTTQVQEMLALAQPEQGQFALKHRIAELEGAVIGLQAQRTWVGLTQEEIEDSYNADYKAQTRDIEAKLKEKNT